MENRINQSIREFIVDRFLSTRNRFLQDTDALLEGGVIDSMGILDLVDFIERQFSFTVSDEELTPENFQNIVHITAYIERKRNGHG